MHSGPAAAAETAAAEEAAVSDLSAWAGPAAVMLLVETPAAAEGGLEHHLVNCQAGTVAAC